MVRTHNRFYHVQVDEVDDRSLMCSPKGLFRQHEDPAYRLPVIGDRVDLEMPVKKQRGVDGFIKCIHKRRNQLSRADADGRRQRVMAANLDRVLVVSAVAEPGLDFALIDRYILTCELEGIDYGLVLNKIDLAPESLADPMLAVYAALDVPLLPSSVVSGAGFDELRAHVGTGISFLTGTSGVGKSSLINELAPEVDLAIGEVDPRGGRGRHTTTNSVLVPLPRGGFLVDSPGLRDFYPAKVEPEQVRFGFREIAAVQAECRFSTCLHDQEPGCAVLDAVEQGLISAQRYTSYLFILGEMQRFFEDRY